MKYPKISDDAEIQKLYVASRKTGASHQFAEMVALRQPVSYHNRFSPLHPRKNRGRGH